MNIHSKQNLKIEQVTDADSAAREAGKYIGDLLSQYIDTPVLLLLAGGSSVKVLDHINPQYLSDQLTVTVTDDRLSDELDENNFAVLQSTSFYNDLIQAEAFCIDTQVNSGESLEDFRVRFEMNIREWKIDFPKSKIIALYGMGEDGHTAGMIPGILDKETFDVEFNNEQRLVGSIDATSKNPGFLRISTTIPFMKKWVDHSVFFITGEQKRLALEKALVKAEVGTSDGADYSKLPVKVISEMKDAIIFTDITGIKLDI